MRHDKTVASVLSAAQLVITGWSGTDVIGIDQGITLLMAENLRTGLVWELMAPWRLQ